MSEAENLADLFALLWHRFESDLSAVEAAFEALEQRVDAAKSEAVRLGSKLDRDGQQALAPIKAWLENDGDGRFTELQRALLVAGAIEQWYAPIAAPRGFREGDRPDDRNRAWRKLVGHSRFNNNESLGLVIPRLPSAGRQSRGHVSYPDDHPDADGADPFELDEVFKTLLVFPSTMDATHPDDACSTASESDPTRTRAVKSRYKAIDARGMRRSPDEDWDDDLEPAWVVGIAPVALGADQIDLRYLEEDGRHWYDVCPVDLCEQASLAIEALCKAGAHIIVLPESTMTAVTLRSVREAVARHGPGSQLRLVIAGTAKRLDGIAPPFNEATVLNHRGQVLGTQCKLHRWNLTADQRAALKVSVPGLDASDKLFEYIRPGEELVLFEYGQLGRFVVMICEDLSRSEPGNCVRKKMLLDWQFTPILDRSIASWRWMAKKGAKAARHCRVVVANSLSLTNRAPAAPEAGTGSLSSQAGVGLCIDVLDGVTYLSVCNVDLTSGPFWLGVPWDVSKWTKVPLSTDIN